MEKVNPDLVVRDVKGKVNTVRYEAVNAMLLNEFLKNIGTSRTGDANSRTANQLSPQLKGTSRSSRSKSKPSLRRIPKGELLAS